MALEMERDRKIDAIARATDELNQKLLLNDDDIEKLLPAHPFYCSSVSRF